MPEFKVKTPDGNVITVRGPEGSTEAQAIDYAKKNYKPQQSAAPPAFHEETDTDTPPPAPSFSDKAVDSVQSFGRGIAQGAIGLAGLPVDAANLLGTGVDKATEYITGVKPPPSAKLPFGSEDITHRVEGAFGKFEEPKTTAGKYAQSVGEFVPAMIGGPETLATKAAGAIGGGLLSEGAGQLTEGTGLEPYARMAGGLIGGGGATALKNERQRLGGAAKLEGEAGIKKAADDGYTVLRQLPNAITPAGMENLQTTVRRTLDQEDFHQLTAGTTYKFVDDITNPEALNKQGPARVKDILAIHNRLGRVTAQVNAEDAKAAQIAREAIRNWLIKNVAGSDMKDAVGNWAAYKKIEDLKGGMSDAELRAGASGTGANYNNTMRQEISKIVRSKSRSRGYKPEELAQMEKIVMGTLEANMSRLGGKFAPTGPVSAIPTILSALSDKASSWPLIGAPLAFGAKYLGEFLTKREIEKLITMVQERAPVNAQQAAINKATLAKQPQAGITAARGAAAGAQHDPLRITVHPRDDNDTAANALDNAQP